MKYLRTTSIAITLSFLWSLSAEAQNADSLLKFMDDLMSAPKDKTATVQMILTDKTGKEKTREALMKQKGKDKKLYRYTKPESQEGVATLSLPGDVMWLYMPAFDEPVKITLLSKNQAFTGTDFSYEDMDSRSYSEKYKPSLIKSENPSYFALELVPGNKKSDYSKIVLTLDKTHFYPIKMEYFDKQGAIFKTADYQYTKTKYWYAKEVLMKDTKKNHSTKIVMNDVKFDQGLSDDEFLVEKLMIKKK